MLRSIDLNLITSQPARFDCNTSFGTAFPNIILLSPVHFGRELFQSNSNSARKNQRRKPKPHKAEASMEAEASLFESSEMLLNFLASTPLLEESWKLCRRANAGGSPCFVANRVGDVAYLAFSGVKLVAGVDPICRELAPLNGAAGEVFAALRRDLVDGEEPVMFHAGLLGLFLLVYHSPEFQGQMLEIMDQSKSIVFTGHSVGGTIASLAALWLLSLQTIVPASSSSLSVLCITFGSPMLGNQSLSRAILQERWGGNFCHVVAGHDIVPRLFFAPLAPLTPHLHTLIQCWYSSTTSTFFSDLSAQLPDEKKAEMFHIVLASLDTLSKGNGESKVSSFWPFGSYIFCSDEGAICVDDATSVIKLLYLILANGSPSSCVVDHLKYEEYLVKIHYQFLCKSSMEGSDDLPQSSFEAGIKLALQSSGIASQDPVFSPAKDCLKMAKKTGRTRNRNSAHLAIRLSRIHTLRAQIEWYKVSCDNSDNQLGYYDSFKQRGASKRDFKVNMNRIKLGQFWDDLIEMLEKNKLPCDFHKREKFVNASQFYKLLVEPLDIAEYYRNGLHHQKGHYVYHGRERRYKIFDKWWQDRTVNKADNKPRSKFASLTQDTCFWAKVEEARDWLDMARTESDAGKSFLTKKIDEFEKYSRKLIEKMEVSKDVLAKNSSYSLFVEEWKEMKNAVQILPTQFHGIVDVEMVP